MCELNNKVCGFDYLEVIGIAVAIFALLLIIINLALSFLEEQAFNIWLKFARIYLLIAFILIILAPATGETGMGFSMGIDHESITWIAAFLFFIISLAIIVRAHRRFKREAKMSPTPFPTSSQKSA